MRCGGGISDVMGENAGGTPNQIENLQALWLVAIGGDRVGDAGPLFLIGGCICSLLVCYVRSFREGRTQMSHSQSLHPIGVIH
jgi:hypothetical protein